MPGILVAGAERLPIDSVRTGGRFLIFLMADQRRQMAGFHGGWFLHTSGREIAKVLHGSKILNRAAALQKYVRPNLIPAN